MKTRVFPSRTRLVQRGKKGETNLYYVVGRNIPDDGETGINTRKSIFSIRAYSKEQAESIVGDGGGEWEGYDE